MLTGRLRTVFGWTVRVGPDANPTSLRNFPMQANGAEMMRLAACLATERGHRGVLPGPRRLPDRGRRPTASRPTRRRMQDAMREASELVLPGFPLKTDAKVVRTRTGTRTPAGSGCGPRWRGC